LASKRPQPPRPRHALFLAALWIAALLAYSNSFSAGLAFDSQRVILADSRIQADTPDNVHQIWTGDYYNGTGSAALYRPLTTLTYLWNYDGPNAAGYHAVNFLLHAINIALVYLIAFAIFADAWPAFALAALWALHPVLTESVTNVVGRADLLAATGILASLYCYLRSGRSVGWRSIAWTAGAAAASSIAIFSKESGVVLIAVLVAYDLAFRAPQPRVRIAGYLAALVPAAIFFAMRQSALAQVSSLLIAYTDNPLQQTSVFLSRLTAFKVLAAYLGLLLWPAHLSPDYSYNQIPIAAGPLAFFALLLWLAIAAAAVLAWRRARAAFFFLAFFAVTIAPVANLVILVGSIMAERFLYLPSIGFLGIVIWAALQLRQRIPARSLVIALSVVCLALAARTWARNADWVDDRILWSAAVQVCPESYKTHQNLAMLALAQPQPDYPTATREVERALAILDPLPDDRNVPSVYATAGQCFRQRGDLPRALTALERARAIDRAWNAAFQARNHQDGKTVPAVGTPPVYLELGRVYVDLGQPDQALEAFREGRKIDPQPAFFEEMARAYRGMGKPEQASISLLEGVALYATQSSMLAELTGLYQPSSPDSCELTRTAAGVSLNMSCPQIHTYLCAATHNMSAMFTEMRDAATAASLAHNAQAYGCGQ
jgi:tetratricopeptide (TPR) repeat protein